MKLSYDALDRLIEVVSLNSTERFSYDSQHRCLSRTVYQLNKKTVEYFLYDGQKEIGSLNEDFQLKEFRLLGETPHAELGSAVAIELDGKIFTPLHDLQSNLAALVSLDGSIPFQADYSAFGEQAVSGSEISPWGFSSKRQYRNLDLVYYGRRFYVPTLGRWLTPDPSGFTDGINLYTFVGNEPLMHFDEYGLWLQPRPPGSFNSWDAMHRMGRDFGQAWNSPRFQGSLQMATGMKTMGMGATLMPTPACVAGFATFAHGADLFTTGAHAFIYGRERPTLARSLLDQVGMPPLAASMIEFMMAPRTNKSSPFSLKNWSGLPNAQQFKPFTANNYRENLKILTGRNPPRHIDAHHVFPQQFREDFRKKGINVDDPKYLVWWESKFHRPTARAYNGIWEKFFFQNPEANTDQILEAGKEMMKVYKIPINY